MKTESIANHNSFAQIRLVLLDMDGTIYHGGTLYPTTVPFLEFLEERGIGHVFLSNNSSYGTREYVAKLAAMGVRSAAEDFYISTDYTIDYLKHHHPEIRRIFLLGMACIVPQFEAAGFVIDEDTPDAVIVAFDRSLVYERLCRAAYFLKQGVIGFATHPDVFCPTDQPTWLVDCGALTACLECSTGVKLKVLGKPDPGMLIAAAARRGVPVEDTLMVGDRLATDVAVGRNAGALTAWITPTPERIPACPDEVAPHIRVRNLGELQQIWSETIQ